MREKDDFGRQAEDPICSPSSGSAYIQGICPENLI